MRPALAMKFGDLACLCACAPPGNSTPKGEAKAEQLLYADEQGQLRVRAGVLGTGAKQRRPDWKGLDSSQFDDEEDGSPTPGTGTTTSPGASTLASPQSGPPSGVVQRASSGRGGASDQRCLVAVGQRSPLLEGKPLLLVSLDNGCVLAPPAGEKAPLRARPGAGAFLARLQAEGGLAVAGFSTAMASGPELGEAAAAAQATAWRAKKVEDEASGFRFDFLLHRSTAGAWQVTDDEAGGGPCLLLEPLAREASACVLTCREGVGVVARPQDAVALVSTYVSPAQGEVDWPPGAPGSQSRYPADFSSLEAESEPLRLFLAQRPVELSGPPSTIASNEEEAVPAAPTLGELASQLPEDWADY